MEARWLRLRLPAALALLGALGLIAGCDMARLDLRPVATAGGEPLEAVGALDPYERGKQHLQEGSFGFALQAFRAALAQDPYSVRTLNALAVTYDQLGRRDLATRFFEQALDADPASAQTLNNMGYSALRRGQIAVAIGYFQRALHQDGANAVIRANLEAADASRGAASAQTQIVVAPVEPYRVRRAAWVERTSAMVQTIVTRPDPALVAAVARFGVEPRLASYYR